jgi:phospholipid/cholesterol/gamma-HCH transport system substrate-binding protein
VRADKSALGLIVLAVAVVALAAVFMHVPTRLTAPGGQTVTAVFADAQTLAKSDPVRMHGVQVGTVKNISLDPGSRSATVEMSISKDALPLYADARAALRWRSLFGAAFYVDLSRGTPAAGELHGQTLAVRRTLDQNRLEDVTSAMVQRQAGVGMRSTLSELPAALRDPAVPSAAFGAMSDTAAPLRRGLRAIQGRRPRDLRELLSNTSGTVQALDTPTDEMQLLVQGAAATVRTTAERREDIARTISVAARMLPRVHATADRLRTTLDLADPLLDRLRDSTGELEPTAARLQGTLTDADRLLADASPLLRSLPPALRSLGSAGRSGAPWLRAITPSVKRAAREILPGFAKKAPDTGLSTVMMIGPAMAGVTGAFASFDANNNFLRFTGSISEASFNSAPCRTAFSDPTATQIATCATLFTALSKVLDPPGARR